jgi:hypothetical protein
MTVVALHALVFGVIELCLWHPAIDEDRFGDEGRRIANRLHFMAKGAAVK